MKGNYRKEATVLEKSMPYEPDNGGRLGRSKKT